MRPQLPFISVASALLFALPALAEADAPRFNAAQDLSFDSATQSASVAVSTQSRSRIRSANWTGVYIGGQLGFGSVDTSTGGENEDFIEGAPSAMTMISGNGFWAERSIMISPKSMPVPGRKSKRFSA